MATITQAERVQAAAAATDDQIMYVDVDGFEGPLDLLLELARRQKVDLSQISVLALSEQYLDFVQAIGEMRIEVAADYLVMAAWLAYLKSRLMVPQAPSDPEPSGQSMAALLQFRLQRLEAMRQAGAKLMARPQLGAQTHARGMPEPIAVTERQLWDVSLFDLLSAYAIQRERNLPRNYTPAHRHVLSLQDARSRLQHLLGTNTGWFSLDGFLAQYLGTPTEAASVRASSFSASLELVRQGRAELRQDGAFGPLYLRARKQAAPTERR